jgi:hypothetical protein
MGTAWFCLYTTSSAGDSRFERVDRKVRNHLRGKYVKNCELDFQMSMKWDVKLGIKITFPIKTMYKLFNPSKLPLLSQLTVPSKPHQSGKD